MVASSIGRWLMVVPGVEITIWPPNGVVLAVLLSSRRGTWIWWVLLAAIGELIANYLWFENPLLPALGYAVANGLEVVVGAWLLRPFFACRNPDLGTLRRVFGFLAFGVLLAPLLGATVGATVSMLSGKAPFHTVWPLWWLGDATGVLVAAPLVFAGVQAYRLAKTPTPAQCLEAALIGLLIVLAWVVLVDRQQAYAFLLFAPILWAAVRFEIRGTALAIALVVVLIGLFHQAHDHSAQDPGAIAGHAILQVLLLVLATTGYVVAAAVRQQRTAMEELADSNSLLEQRVRERMQDIEMAQRQFQTMFENAAVGMTIVDPGGTMLRVNPTLAEMLGYRPDEMVQRPVEDFTHAEDLQKSIAARERLNREPQTDSYALEKRYLRRDGSVIWGLTSVSCVRGPDGAITFVIKIIQDISARKEREVTRQAMMNEVNHRSKNLLSLIQAIARQTGSQASPAFHDSFSRRLHALAANQDLLVRSSWESVQLEELVRAQLQPFDDTTGSQFTLSGPSLQLSARAAQALGMALHELATNAAKYGSLSTASGRVEIGWSVEGGNLTITWRERDGPPITQPPGTKGFGTTVIGALIQSTLDAEVSVDFAESGLVWTCRCPLTALRDAQQDHSEEAPVA